MRKEDERAELTHERFKKDPGVNRLGQGTPCVLLMGLDPKRRSGVFPIHEELGSPIPEEHPKK